eukprot:scaffold155037_cov19-Prasinocladus_malaysianus.AAC.2
MSTVLWYNTPDCLPSAEHMFSRQRCTVIADFSRGGLVANSHYPVPPLAWYPVFVGQKCNGTVCKRKTTL